MLKKIFLSIVVGALVIISIGVIKVYMDRKKGKEASSWAVERYKLREGEPRDILDRAYSSLYIRVIKNEETKQDVAILRDNYCYKISQICSEINLVSSVLFASKKTKGFYERSQSSLEFSRKYFESNLHVYPIEYEVAWLYVEVSRLRNLDTGLKDEAIDVLKNIKIKGGGVFDLTNNKYDLFPENSVYFERVYLALLANIFAYSGDMPSAVYIFSNILNQEFRKI